VTVFPDIATLVPHAGPSCLLDSVIEAGRERTVCRALVPPDHPYLASAGVHSLLAIELFAQAAAVHRALALRAESARAESAGAESGRLAAAQATLLTPRLARGSCLRVAVVPKGSFGGLLAFGGELSLEQAGLSEVLLATGEISVALDQGATAP